MTQRSPLGRFLVAGRFMRGLYGAVKATTFGWVLLVQPLPEAAPMLWLQWGAAATDITALLIWSSVVLCLARGIPVVAEFVTERQVLGLRHGAPGTG